MYKVFVNIVTLLGFIISVSAQEKIEVMRYEFEMTMPSVNKEADNKEVSLKTETVYLDILGSESRCTSEGNIRKEEELLIFSKEPKDRSLAMDRLQVLNKYRSSVKWTVYKSKTELNTYDSSGFDIYKVGESTNLIKWDISSEVEEYNDMKVQKAVGELSGRIWTVWFTQDIPLIDGPYKFKNLPGFVVKAEDGTGDYKLEFLKSEKVTTSYWLTERNAKAMAVDKKQWNKIRNTNANKNANQILGERGITLKSKEDTSERLTKKLGKEDKPIEFY
ncbi:GLPGLI family protein [Myroides sp. M-43]|uniref:GLPGLI family protein n=1 Tax=Myroides oncorhynchi TaxID=2893756 RepID=UPI001E32785A|nr:GLPGLI family protein [Myroides oncorhynchi]MCC9043058.1 GLPGLI family protein [Myroides oncorhynchi]